MTAATKTKGEEAQVEEEAPKEQPVETPEEEDPQVIDLTTLAPNRRMVKIPTKRKPEGEPFEIRLLDDFGIKDQQQLLSWNRRFEKYWNSEEDLSESEQDTMEVTMNKIFWKVLDAPKEVKDSVVEAVRSRIVMAFTLAPLFAQQEALAKEQKEKEEKEKAEKEKNGDAPTTES